MKLRTLALTLAAVVGIAAPATAMAQSYGHGGGYGFQRQGGHHQGSYRGQHHQRGYAIPSHGAYGSGYYNGPPARAHGWDNGYYDRQNFGHRSDRREGWSHRRVDHHERRH